MPGQNARTSLEAPVNAISSSFAGVGVYRVPVAARLAAVPVNKARAWVTGYPRKGANASSRGTARLPPRLPQRGSEAVVSFADLIEMRFVRHFRAAGVKWSVITKALPELREIFRLSPAGDVIFESDGVRVFADALAKTGDRHALDLTSGNFVMADVLRGSFKEELRLDTLGIVRAWKPRAEFPSVVIDPRRQFGQPIVEPGTPTAVIADEYVIRQGDAEKVAVRYGVTVNAVMDAVRFEQSLKGAA